MPILTKIVVFIVVSIALLWLTRKSFAGLRSRGLYRFLALECVIVLALLNLDVWFRRPFSPHQIISWLLLTISTILVVHGAMLLREVGKPSSERSDPSLIGIEKTTKLVEVGAYRWIRHPMYSSGLFAAWGAFCKQPSWQGVVLAALATVLFTMTAKLEEAENIEYFGDEYRSYIKRTKMFVPYLF